MTGGTRTLPPAHWDRGKELTDHRRFTLATKIDVYFCDPQSPWQRGSNENTNGLLRSMSMTGGADLSLQRSGVTHHVRTASRGSFGRHIRAGCAGETRKSSKLTIHPNEGWKGASSR